MLAYDITGLHWLYHYRIILRFFVFSTFFFHLMHPAHHSAASAGGPRELLTALLVLVEPVPLDVASPAMTVLYFYSSHGLQAVVPEALLMHMHEYC